MSSITNTLQQASPITAAKPRSEHLTGKTWVTRRGVKVDRIATGWLILRFIDPQARLLFVDPDRHSPNSLRYV